MPRPIVEESILVLVPDQGDSVAETTCADRRSPHGVTDGVGPRRRRKGKGPCSYGIERRASAVAQRPTPAIQLATVLWDNVGSSS